MFFIKGGGKYLLSISFADIESWSPIIYPLIIQTRKVEAEEGWWWPLGHSLGGDRIGPEPGPHTLALAHSVYQLVQPLLTQQGPGWSSCASAERLMLPPMLLCVMAGILLRTGALLGKTPESGRVLYPFVKASFFPCPVLGGHGYHVSWQGSHRVVAPCAHGTAWHCYSDHWTYGVRWSCGAGGSWTLSEADGSWELASSTSSSSTCVLFLKTSLNSRKSFLLSTLNLLCFSLNPFPLHCREDRVPYHQLWAETPHILESFAPCHFSFLKNLCSLNLNS